MAGELFGVFCTADINTEILDDFLEKAYSHPSSIDTSPSLCILTHLDFSSYDPDDASQPPIAPFQSPFLGMDATSVASLLNERAKDTAINCSCFIVADERSASDSSVLLVKVGRDAKPAQLQSVRIGFEQANGLICALSVGARGIKEPQEYIGDDGVYRGEPSPPPGGPQKGTPAPRKQLP